MPKPITPETNLEALRKEAKRRLKALRASDAHARTTLREVQHALALEYGLPGWGALKLRLAPDAPLRRYEAVAGALVTAYRTGEPTAMQTVWDYFGHMRTWDAMRSYVRLDLGIFSDEHELTLTEAKSLVARAQGFETWDALAEYAATATANLAGLDGRAQMTDEHTVSLDLSGSKITDTGLRSLSRLQELRHLNLSGCAVSDHGLEVLRTLPRLESIDLTWTRTGDGAIRALAGNTALRHLRSGNGVTDAGLAALHDLPVFKTWQGGAPTMNLLSHEAGPNSLLLRGPFTDAGMAQLAGLDGLFALNLDDSALAITNASLAPLASLPHLGWLAFDAKDDSMPLIAALPHLRFLMCQDTTAGDDGFAALSRSQTLAYIWGRRCHNLRRRGFTALAEMPSLRSLSVSLVNVDDAGLSALPRFPALTELMPMDMPDEAYRHIGRCERIESLVLMYCRDTTDVATRHITALPALKKYFASYNRITDRTPEMLATMTSLEEITFDSCSGLTDAGIARLARLPNLRSLRLSGMPGVTAKVAANFDPEVRVSWPPYLHHGFTSSALPMNGAPHALFGQVMFEYITCSDGSRVGIQT